MEDSMTTTFHYPREKYWKFKAVLTARQHNVKTACSQLLDRYIEDYQDLTTYKPRKPRDKQVTWNEFKRRMNLDEL